MKQVLSVGNCSMDHGNLTRFLTKHFQVSVIPAATADEAIGLLRKQAIDLVLVNRQFDRDSYEGIDFIRSLKDDSQLSRVPVMLLTNFADYAKQAVEAGAAPGFGKAELSSPELPKRLDPYLGQSSVQNRAEATTV